MKTGPLVPVTSVAWAPITALTVCTRIRVQEDQSEAGWPTAPFKVAVPTSADGPMQLDAGAAQVFERKGKANFVPGDVVGYLKMTTGSTYYSQYED